MNETKMIAGIDNVAEWLDEVGARRVLLIVGPERRFVERLALPNQSVEIFDGAEVHVPRETVDRAAAALLKSESDTIVTLGGGSATGLGKALRLTHDVRFVAIPTTYAGSEMTRIYGIREAGEKNTGRDDKVRPDVVVHEPTLFTGMPLRLTVTSLFNALAHPISALSAEAFEGQNDALRAIEDVVWAIDQLLEAPTSRSGRERALRGAALAARVLDRATLGEHHRRAHSVGGRYALDHAALHAALLPHTVAAIARDNPELYATITKAAGYEDLPAFLYDTLTRAKAPRSLLDLGVKDELGAELEDVRLGRRPSVKVRRNERNSSLRGPALADAERVIIAVHGRGANADRMLRDVQDWIGHDAHTTIVAPQAPHNRWYEQSYRAEDFGDALPHALDAVNAEIAEALAHVPAQRVFLAGFSQGACLALEAFARADVTLGGVVAPAGARLGPAHAYPAIPGRAGAKVLLGVAQHDKWVDLADVEATAAQLRDAGADVTVLPALGDVHEVTALQRVHAHEILRGVDVREGQRGFGNAHDSEALPGALPIHQNSPRHAPYGLYPEQINGSGFVAHRKDNLRSWFYRIRPAAQHTPFERLEHATFVADWDDGPVDANLSAHAARAIPEEPTDFVDGMATYGGAGAPSARRGYAVHLYVANRSMEHRSFYNADGDLLIIPQMGRLTLQTELGILDVDPGQIAVLPRGLKVSVHLPDGAARGYVGEIYGRHFELPERGPVGANGLTDPRHFVAPSAFFEDRVDPGYRVTAKLDNALYEATQDHSPYDVVAWHGDYVPYVYDLKHFSPVGNVRFDHPDPSIYTVIGAGMDEVGAHTLDFVFFPPRWDASEHTFRPPFFHRNATTEYNGIIADPGLSPDGPFTPGMSFLTPSMTAHGVLARGVHRAFQRNDEVADRPHRVSDASAWFQFESALPLRLTRWAKTTDDRIDDWSLIWGSYRSRFRPD